jgi:hypothetical protein
MRFAASICMYVYCFFYIKVAKVLCFFLRGRMNVLNERNEKIKAENEDLKKRIDPLPKPPIQ